MTEISERREPANATLNERRENFIKKTTNIHKGKYDYSLVNYESREIPIIIICKIHGKFWQRPRYHMDGHGCPLCAIGKRTTTDVGFVKQSNVIHHSKYDYSKVTYKNAHTHVIITCPKHGDFNQLPMAHIKGCGCPMCKEDKLSMLFRGNVESFVEKSKKIHGDRYNYDLVIYRNAKKKVVIQCPSHGEFYQTPDSHLRGSNCPSCNSSKGELKIIYFLNKNNISYIHQKRFVDCINPNTNYQLPFDFYISSYNLLIEFDGEQHFKINARNGGYITSEKDLLYIRHKDNIKTQYAINKNIKLLRIPYFKIKQVDKILREELKTI